MGLSGASWPKFKGKKKHSFQKMQKPTPKHYWLIPTLKKKRYSLPYTASWAPALAGSSLLSATRGEGGQASLSIRGWGAADGSGRGRQEKDAGRCRCTTSWLSDRATPGNGKSGSQGHGGLFLWVPWRLRLVGKSMGYLRTMLKS